MCVFVYCYLVGLGGLVEQVVGCWLFTRYSWGSAVWVMYVVIEDHVGTHVMKDIHLHWINWIV